MRRGCGGGYVDGLVVTRLAGIPCFPHDVRGWGLAWRGSVKWLARRCDGTLFQILVGEILWGEMHLHSLRHGVLMGWKAADREVAEEGG